MYWMIGISLVSIPLVLFLWGRRNERAIRRDWELLLSQRGERVYHAVEQRLHSRLDLADVTYDEAFSVRELSTEEAIHLLDVGYHVIEQFSPSLLRLLAAMAAFSRMVAAMAPVSPLHPGEFKLAQLASLAQLNRILHQFLVSTAERFRLRVYILARGVGLALRYLYRTTRRIVRRQSVEEREWEQIQSIREDLHTLTDESLDSLRMLLSSISAEKRELVLELFPKDGVGP